MRSLCSNSSVKSLSQSCINSTALQNNIILPYTELHSILYGSYLHTNPSCCVYWPWQGLSTCPGNNDHYPIQRTATKIQKLTVCSKLPMLEKHAPICYLRFLFDILSPYQAQKDADPVVMVGFKHLFDLNRKLRQLYFKAFGSFQVCCCFFLNVVGSFMSRLILTSSGKHRSQ